MLFCGDTELVFSADGDLAWGSSETFHKEGQQRFHAQKWNRNCWPGM